MTINCNSASDVGNYQYTVVSEIVNMPQITNYNPYTANFAVNIWPSCLQIEGPAAAVDVTVS
jgi:hypothetical protein